MTSKAEFVRALFSEGSQLHWIVAIGTFIFIGVYFTAIIFRTSSNDKHAASLPLEENKKGNHL